MSFFFLLLPSCAAPLQRTIHAQPAQHSEGPVERRPEHDIVVADFLLTREYLQAEVSNLRSCGKTTLERQEIVTHRKRGLVPERVILEVAAIAAGAFYLLSVYHAPDQPHGGNYFPMFLLGIGFTTAGTSLLLSDLRWMEDRHIRNVRETKIPGEPFVCERVPGKGARLKLVFHDETFWLGVTGENGQARFPLDAALRRALQEHGGRFTLWLDGKKHTPVNLSRKLSALGAGEAGAPDERKPGSW